MSHTKKGFTLIELLVVIAIIGVLASVVLASLNNARKKSRDARRITDIKQVQLALELYFDGQASPSYPDTIYSNAAFTPKYIQSVPTDPTAAANYKYVKVSSTQYHLGAVLEDYNPALANDADSDSSATTGGFKGASSDCAAATTPNDNTERCFDVIP